MFEASVLSQSASMELIGRFGFHTSADTDKFADTAIELDEAGVPYVAEQTVAHFLAKVKGTLDLGTHMLIVGEVVQAETLFRRTHAAYAYYHQVKGGKTPPKASSYEAPEELRAKTTLRRRAPSARWHGAARSAAISNTSTSFPTISVARSAAWARIFERIEL